MSHQAERERVLIEQLEIPADSRDSGGDPELDALLKLAQDLEVSWLKIEPLDGAKERVHEKAGQIAASRRRPRLRSLWSRRRPVVQRRHLHFPWPARAAIAAGTLAAAILVVVSLTGNPPGTGKILARAEAAISATDKIFHMVFDSNATVVYQGKRTKTRSRIESWTYFTDVTRSHVISKDKVTGSDLEVVVTPTESRTYFASTDTVYVQATDVGTKTPPGARPGASPGSLQDALGLIREAFGDKKVKFVGETEVSGRPAYEMQLDLSGKMGIRQGKLTYIVDKKSYLPLETRSRTETVSPTGRIRVRSHELYRKFKLLEPERDNLAQLKMRPHPGAKVIRLPSTSVNSSPIN